MNIRDLRTAGVRRLTLNLWITEEGEAVWTCYLAADHEAKTDAGVALEFSGATPEEAIAAAVAAIPQRREARTTELADRRAARAEDLGGRR